MGVVRSRIIALLLALGMTTAVGLSSATPAYAAYNVPYSVGVGGYGDVWGTITFTGQFSFTANGNLYNDNAGSLSFRLCYWHWEDSYGWNKDGCLDHRYNNVRSTSRSFSGISKPSHFARLGVVTVELWANGSRVQTSGFLYNPYVV